MKNSFISKLYAFFAVLFWASAFISTNLILKNSNITPMQLGTIRYFLAIFLLLPIMITKKITIPKVNDVVFFMLSGFFGFTSYMFFFNNAIKLINPATASIINSTVPGLTAILSYFIFNEYINSKGKFGILLSFLGVILLNTITSKLDINLGVYYMIGAAGSLALYNISQRFILKKYEPNTTMFFSLFFGTIFLFIFNYSSMTNFTFNFNKFILFNLIYLAIFPSIISYFFWTKAISISNTTTEIANFMFLVPILTTIMCYSILFFKIDQLPTIETYIAGAIILIGMVIFSRRNKHSIL